MDKYLWLIPALPLGGFLILAFAGNYLTRKWVAMVGAGSICLSALAAIAVGSALLVRICPQTLYTHRLYGRGSKWVSLMRRLRSRSTSFHWFLSL
jgi:NADH-quinone oxidoreductase subunit L